MQWTLDFKAHLDKTWPSISRSPIVRGQNERTREREMRFKEEKKNELIPTHQRMSLGNRTFSFKHFNIHFWRSVMDEASALLKRGQWSRIEQRKEFDGDKNAKSRLTNGPSRSSTRHQYPKQKAKTQTEEEKRKKAKTQWLSVRALEGSGNRGIGRVISESVWPSLEATDCVCAKGARKSFQFAAEGERNGNPDPIEPGRRRTMLMACKDFTIRDLGGCATTHYVLMFNELFLTVQLYSVCHDRSRDVEITYEIWK